MNAVTQTAPAPLWSTWGLFAAWLVHDIEEALTMPAWTSRQPSTFGGRRLPIPELSPLQVRVAIGTAGFLVAVASEVGRRSGGRSRFYQTGLAAFGWHSVTHLATSVVTRGYSPGVATVMPVVVPFSVAARRALKNCGIAIPDRDLAAGAVTTFVATLAVSHGMGHLIGRHSA